MSLGNDLSNFFLKAGNIYSNIKSAQYTADVAAAEADLQARVDVARAQSKKWLYGAIGLVIAVFAWSFISKKMR